MELKTNILGSLLLFHFGDAVLLKASNIRLWMLNRN